MSNEVEIVNCNVYAKDEEVTPQDLLRLAKHILTTVAFIFILSMFIRIISKDVIVFEACKTILPPIATGVIGFYFGRSN